MMTREQRRKNMQAIKSVSMLESIVSGELWKRGHRFRRNTKGLPGKPDISIKKYKVVIFIDSCFWHQCPKHGNMPKTNVDYWEKKLQRNKERDMEITNYYRDRKWNIIRIWEHDLKNDFERVIGELDMFINSVKEKNNRDNKL